MKKKEVGVIGIGKFGFSLAQTLTELGHRVVGLDQDTDRVQRLSHDLAAVYSGDATDKSVLEQLRFQDLDTVVVSIGNSMESSILTVLNLLDLNVRELIVKAGSPQHAIVLRRLGVHQVVQPEMEIARQTAHRINNPGLLDFLTLGGGTLLQTVTVKKWAGKTLMELNLPTDHGIMAVAEKNKGDHDFSFVPFPRKVLEEGGQLVLIGPAAKIMALEP
ncbi:TrkA family potassium uptake protein [Desulfosarcina sp. OttesenSCG-928-B08]|nr:TrkA family potassium uptake protein [Desulfosarcina sp. OttesenSCG-928-B08]